MKLIYIKTSIFKDAKKLELQLQAVLDSKQNIIKHIKDKHQNYYFDCFNDFKSAFMDAIYLDDYKEFIYTIVISNNKVLIKNWLNTYNPLTDSIEYLDTASIKNKIKKGER